MVIPDEKKECFLMNIPEKRLATFSDWPFKDGCECTPEKMAAAGFYHCGGPNEPDLVRCFVCLKELDGWEPDDDPCAEHKSHSPKCFYLKVLSDIDEGKLSSTTLETYYMIELERYKKKIDKLASEKITELVELSKDTKEEMYKIIK